MWAHVVSTPRNIAVSGPDSIAIAVRASFCYTRLRAGCCWRQLAAMTEAWIQQGLVFLQWMDVVIPDRRDVDDFYKIKEVIHSLHHALRVVCERVCRSRPSRWKV